MDYIVVQAGGKGTRLKYLTQNKPKALVPVEFYAYLRCFDFSQIIS